MKPILSRLTAILLFILTLTNLSAQPVEAGFDSPRWQFLNADTIQYEGRLGLIGSALLSDVEFTNGIIEVDLIVTGERSYPGLIFRMGSYENYERVYVRPHRAGLYPDAIQYSPSINGVTEWQFCNGDGYTAPIVLPENEWFTMKMEIKGTRANLYIGDNTDPALEMHNLKNGVTSGSIGVFSDGRSPAAVYSNFRYELTDDIKFEDPPFTDLAPGMIRDWDYSGPYKYAEKDIKKYPLSDKNKEINWQSISADPAGLVDIGLYTGRTGAEPDYIIAKTILHAENARTMELNFGYSDLVSIFLNGRLMFTGNSAYQSRDPSFLGIIGLFDAIYLPLEKGDNELVLKVYETFGGWGFMCQDGADNFYADGLSKGWETDVLFKIPESVAHDPAGNEYYVSNYDGYNPGQASQAIAKISSGGKLIDAGWLTGLANPTGITVHDGKLYITQRKELTIVDIKTASIEKSYPKQDAAFMNDVAVSPDGDIFVSDSRKHLIYKLEDGQLVDWLADDDIKNPNGLHILDGNLFVGNGNNYLMKVDVKTKDVSSVAHLNTGIIDGIKSDKNGNLIVSHNEGRLFRITREGEITKIADLTPEGIRMADFDINMKDGVIVIPTFTRNTVIAINYSQQE
ncbi:MAG: SMP-30/gluconolactonase/LRE family protein [Bacteroidales bacterium]|nr:SMP-30/gluconolactonase/LRE family protein [Bacteroidales bacterium]